MFWGFFSLSFPPSLSHWVNTALELDFKLTQQQPQIIRVNNFWVIHDEGKCILISQIGLDFCYGEII